MGVFNIQFNSLQALLKKLKATHHLYLQKSLFDPVVLYERTRTDRLSHTRKIKAFKGLHGGFSFPRLLLALKW